MKCEKVQQGIDAYINHTLPSRDMPEFIRHIKQCEECYNELETYFIVDHAIRYLDEETEEIFNVKRLLDEDLDRRLVKVKYRKILIRMFITLAVILGIAAITGFLF